MTGPVKAALLIGVGNHASARSEHLGWNLDVSDELSTMKSTLKSEAGFGYIETLADDKATLSNIEGFLTQRLPARLSGEGHTLLIYYTGHGVVQGQERCWFTYYTDFSSDHYSKLLTASTLADWINRLKTDRDIKVCLVMDACATREKPPKRPPTEIRLGDERIFAAEKGHMASTGVFTTSFFEAMDALKDQKTVHFKDLFDRIR